MPRDRFEDTTPDPRSDQSASPSLDSQVIAVIALALAGLSPKAQGVIVQMFQHWVGLPPKRRALMLKTLMQDLTDQQVADAVGVSRTTLHDWHEYMRLKALLKAPRWSVRHALTDRDDDEGDDWLQGAGVLA